jgi:hypothetical protein
VSAESYERTPEGYFSSQDQRLQGVERRIGRVPARLRLGGTDSMSSYRGTETQRDALYGSPSTAPDQAILANARISWFNTETGWQEMYYATTGTAGLTVRGLVAGVPSGWYPIGLGPYQRLRPMADFSINPGDPVRGWSGRRYSDGRVDWFGYNDANGRVLIQKGGNYDLRVWTTQQVGSGVANYHLRVLSGGFVEDHVDGLAFPLVSNLWTKAGCDASMQILPGREVDFFCHAGALIIHNGGSDTTKGEFLVRYTGPALVTD